MAEDPVDAMTGGSLVNTHIYLENKLRKPLESVSGPVQLMPSAETLPTLQIDCISDLWLLGNFRHQP
jgi:hypothetical protein